MQPLISASLIVRDEEQDLPRCLASLKGLVDEIVIHDTGSVDSTIPIALAAGAKVIEGRWENDFSRARNTSLDACSGEWVLIIDADEEIDCDPIDVHRQLRNAPTELDAFLVTIGNLADDGNVGLRHRSIRLFRPNRARWHGALHEQLRPTRDQQIEAALLTGVELLHYGYIDAAMVERDKATRNIELAEAALASATPIDEARLLLNLARSLATMGRYEDALRNLQRARALPASQHSQAWLLRSGAETCLALNRPDDALGWVGELRRRGFGSEVADLLEGSALVQLGRGAEAIALFEGITEAWDSTGVSVPEHLVHHRRGLARIAAGDHTGAAIDLLALVIERPQIPAWGQLANAAQRGDGTVGAVDIAAAIPDAHMRAALVQLLFADVDAAEAVAQSLWQRSPCDPRLLAFAVNHATRLDVRPALEWSVRLRAAGLEEHCPLLARATHEGLPALERVLAAAVCYGTFADYRCADGLADAAMEVGDGELRDALLLLNELAPSLLPSFVATIAIQPGRISALANALDQLGASEQASLLRAG